MNFSKAMNNVTIPFKDVASICFATFEDTYLIFLNQLDSFFIFIKNKTFWKTFFKYIEQITYNISIS